MQANSEFFAQYFIIWPVMIKKLIDSFKKIKD